MAVAQRMTLADYEAVVLSGVDGQEELHVGRLVEKPGMSWEHSGIAGLLTGFLQQPLDLYEYLVSAERQIRRPESTVFMPDVAVVPVAYGASNWGRPGRLANLTETLPLVVEVWSESTGDYDIDTEVPVYQPRGDLEIWRIHPYDRILTWWVHR